MSGMCNCRSVYHTEHLPNYQAKLLTKILYSIPKQFKYGLEKSGPERVQFGGPAVILPRTEKRGLRSLSYEPEVQVFRNLGPGEAEGRGLRTLYVDKPHFAFWCEAE